MKELIFIVLIFNVFNVKAQMGLTVKNHVYETENISFSPLTNSTSSFSDSSFPTMPTNSYQPPRNLRGLYNCDELAFFCKVELKLENKIKLPVKFRLGSLDYVNKLEGKGFKNWEN